MNLIALYWTRRSVVCVSDGDKVFFPIVAFVGRMRNNLGRTIIIKKDSQKCPIDN